jgi:ribosomal protein L30E
VFKKSTEKISKKKDIILAEDFTERFFKYSVQEYARINGEQVINYKGTAVGDFCAFRKLKNTHSTDTKHIHKFTREAKGSCQ